MVGRHQLTKVIAYPVEQGAVYLSLHEVLALGRYVMRQVRILHMIVCSRPVSGLMPIGQRRGFENP